MDVFHYRLLTLFYRAWAEARPEISHDRSTTTTGRRVSPRFSGRGMPACGARAAGGYRTLLLHRLPAAQTRYPDGLRVIPSGVFRGPGGGRGIRRPMAGAARAQPPRRRLDEPGHGRLPGHPRPGPPAQVPPPPGAAGLDHQRFLPDGDHFVELAAWVAEYLGEELDWTSTWSCNATKVPRPWAYRAAGGSVSTPGWAIRPGRQGSIAGPPVRHCAAARAQGRRNMSEISRVALFGKLNSLAYKAIRDANEYSASCAVIPIIELVHWFHQILSCRTRTCTRSSASPGSTRRAWPGPDRGPRPPAAARPRSPTCPPMSRKRWERGWITAA